MNPSTVQLVGSILFSVAVLHTFLTSQFRALAHRYREGSPMENLFHLLGEVEVVFGFWAGVFIIYIAVFIGGSESVQYAESRNYTEPLFVFAIMAMAATKPVIEFVEFLIFRCSSLFPIPREAAIFLACLIFGPLLGSFVTEPAAMTVTALALRDRFYTAKVSDRFKYLTIAVLFVNVSIGGTLTHFAAPPVLMVAAKWGWDTPYMLEHFGYKAILAVVFNAVIATFILRRELWSLPKRSEAKMRTPWWMVLIHLGFMAAVVATAHHPVIFIGAFLFFMGFVTITQEYQSGLKLKESLLVGFFLAGLVVLGGVQDWWLSPLIRGFNEVGLFLGATALTAITDNAALTYLGSQVEGISEAFQYALVAGAVTGGGLTVIANAPNPAGFSILQDRFGADGISPIKLFLYALGPTILAALSFWFLPTIHFS